MPTNQVRNLAVTSIVALLLFALSQCGHDDTNPADGGTGTELIGDTSGDTVSDTTGNDSTANDSTVDTTGMVTVADHFAVAGFDSLSGDQITAVQSNLRIFYGHTSHGSQIITGLDMLLEENSSLTQPEFHELWDDLGETGDVSWVQPTRDFLDANPDYNVVMWSWCGGCSNNTVEGIEAYLEAMSTLESDYPEVVFIYMTGHLDGTGPEGNLYARNNQIREYCVANAKVLYDFADIESYDPDGNYYPYASDACEWCAQWCATYVCPTCISCAHSHCFNCYLKGKAMWWLMVRLVE